MRRGRLLAAPEGKDPRKNIRLSRAQEKQLAKDVGGKVQVASGARWDRKGDVVAPEHLYEAKMTSAESYSLKLKEWRKVKFEAIMTNKTPVMAVQIQDERLAVLSWGDYLTLTERRQGT